MPTRCVQKPVISGVFNPYKWPTITEFHRVKKPLIIGAIALVITGIAGRHCTNTTWRLFGQDRSQIYIILVQSKIGNRTSANAAQPSSFLRILRPVDQTANLTTH